MKNNIRKIEQLFTNNLKSPSYIILATYYYNQRLYDYAQKVCEIGLKNDSSNIDGRYMLAKILLISNNINKAEKLLEGILYNEPYHLNTILLLIQIKQSKGEEKQDIFKALMQSIMFYSDHPIIKQSIVKTIQKIKKVPSKKSNFRISQNFKINTKLATKTLYQLLLSQKKFQEAQDVLLIMKKINKNKQFVGKELKKIKQYIN